MPCVKRALIGFTYSHRDSPSHSSEAMVLAYLGLDQASTEEMLDNIDFG